MSEQEPVQVVSKAQAKRLRAQGALPATPEQQDNLAQAAEELSAEGGVIDLENLKVENELAQHFNDLDVSNKQPGFVYSWPWTGSAGFFVKQKCAQGWEVVQSDMPEALELKDATGVRRLGDVILMRIRIDRFLQIERRRNATQAMRQRGVTSSLEDMARKARKHGVILHLTGQDMDIDNPIIKRAMAKAAARQTVAKGPMTDMLKAGAVPGMPTPGSN